MLTLSFLISRVIGRKDSAWSTTTTSSSTSTDVEADVGQGPPLETEGVKETAITLLNKLRGATRHMRDEVFKCRSF